jgi:hypothetical protein
MYTPSERVEVDKINAQWIEQKAQLEARLKDVFECSSSDLLCNESATFPKTSETLSPLSASPLALTFPASKTPPLLTPI